MEDSNKMKRKIVIGMVVLAAVVLISGASYLAFATPGTQADPFITLSYLTEVFRPQVMADVEKAENELTEKFEARIAELESALQAGQGGPGQAAAGSAERFSVVTLRNGQSLTCSVGTEIMLRIGTAAGTGSAPALVNYTTGSTLSSGTDLTPNHMYLVTIEGNGIRATADTVRVLVRGSHRIT
jgi:hypothetical protein